EKTLEAIKKSEAAVREARKIEETTTELSQDFIKKSEAARKMSEEKATEVMMKSEHVARKAGEAALAASENAKSTAEEAVSMARHAIDVARKVSEDMTSATDSKVLLRNIMSSRDFITLFIIVFVACIFGAVSISLALSLLAF
ncbi:hypothetical protein ACFLWZ_07920, partial [Chloroflexota bacterium]